MTQNPVFRGAATALVTPMRAGEVDYAALKSLINWQIEAGIDALVIAGTTGEGSTLTDEEHRRVLAYSAEVAEGRVPIIAATGSNDTAYAIDLSKFACQNGSDALLVVTPYYNKATQNGLIKTYFAIADAVTKPIILYNVPSRTGVGIEPETYLKMAEHPLIKGIKEANGNISKIAETAMLVGDKLDIYSGNDDQIVPVLSLGGSGVISVLSNLLPYETSRICHSWFEGNTAQSLNMQLKYLKLINALFSEVNPIPVKAALAKMGKIDPEIRLPLTPMEDAHAQKLFALMEQAGLISL